MTPPPTSSEPTRRFVLASASPARLATLRNAGLDPEVVVSGVDEDRVTEPDPASLALTLAQLKAAAVAADQTHGPGAWVLGCDSVLELDGAVHGKPANPAEARRRWLAMRGHVGVLHTGHCLIDTAGDRQVSRAASTQVSFADLTDAEIDAYVDTGEPMRVAGAFTIDGLGGPFVRSIAGDHHAVVGLSLPVLREMFAAFGVAWPDLWRHYPVTAGRGV